MRETDIVARDSLSRIGLSLLIPLIRVARQAHKFMRNMMDLYTH
jgi:hypothetical protein